MLIPRGGAYAPNGTPSRAVRRTSDNRGTAPRRRDQGDRSPRLEAARDRAQKGRGIFSFVTMRTRAGTARGDFGPQDDAPDSSLLAVGSARLLATTQKRCRSRRLTAVSDWRQWIKPLNMPTIYCPLGFSLADGRSGTLASSGSAVSAKSMTSFELAFDEPAGGQMMSSCEGIVVGSMR